MNTQTKNAPDSGSRVLIGFKKKTWKREVATAVLIFLGVLALEDDKEEQLRILALPGVTFAALAFGLDWHRKQNGV